MNKLHNQLVDFRNKKAKFADFVLTTTLPLLQRERANRKAMKIVALVDQLLKLDGYEPPKKRTIVQPLKEAKLKGKIPRLPKKV